MYPDFSFTQTNQIKYRSFVKAPKELIFGEEFMNISSLAKFLLIIMFERLDLSVKNNWADAKGNIYIILSHEEAKKFLSCSETKVKKLYAELTANNLIKTKKQGLGKPNLIYINSGLFAESTEKDSQESFNAPLKRDAEKPSAKSLENSPDSFRKPANHNNNKYNKNNNKNHINQSKEEVQKLTEERNECKEFIKDIISYNYLIGEKYDKGVLDCIVDASVNILCTESPFVRVGKRNIPYEEVKKRIYNLDVNLVEHIYQSLKGIKNTVRNPTNYLITTIYNALDTSCMGFA